MIDIHSHILFGVDDGPSSIEGSLDMVNEAIKAGVKIIIATPHYKKEVYDTKKIVENYNLLVKRTRGLDISIFLGYEVLINPVLPIMVNDKKILSLNNSGYMLLELPFDSVPIYLFETIFKLQLLEISIIIAHPERNCKFYKDIDLLLGLVERGCLIQLDAASIIGANGRRAKELSKKLIKLKVVSFVASDAHNYKDYSISFLKSYKRVRKWTDEAYSDKLFQRNALSIVKNNEELISSNTK